MTSRQAFLLGAGAVKEARMPLATEITKLLLDKQRQHTPEARALSFVVGSIIRYDTRGTGRPDVLPDVERVVSAVELLSERLKLEVTPFIDAWDPTVLSLEMPPAASGASAFHDLRRHLLGGAGSGGTPNDHLAQRALEQLIDARVGGQPVDVFGRLLAGLLRDLVDLLTIEEGHDVSHLLPLMSLATAGSTIATLNYDLVIERAADESATPYSRGIESWSQTGRIDWPDGSFRLHKLHGSIDWVRAVPGPSQDGPLVVPRPTIVGEKNFGYVPFLVFGQREKLRPEGPFLQLLESFRDSLTHSVDLIVVGYAFRDRHINEVIAQWINGDASRRLVIIDPDFPARASWSDDFRNDLMRGLREDYPPAGAMPRPRRLAVARQKASSAFRQMAEQQPQQYIDALFAPDAEDQW